MKKRYLKIAIDLDDTIAQFSDSFNKHFKCDISQMKDAEITRLVETLRLNKDFWSNLDVLERPDFVYNIKTNEILPTGSEATALCAIGQPQQFYVFLKDYTINKTIDFDDHHCYIESELPQSRIITTEKDAVKMKDFYRDDIYALKLKTVLDIESLL